MESRRQWTIATESFGHPLVTCLATIVPGGWGLGQKPNGCGRVHAVRRLREKTLDVSYAFRRFGRFGCFLTFCYFFAFSCCFGMFSNAFGYTWDGVLETTPPRPRNGNFIWWSSDTRKNSPTVLLAVAVAAASSAAEASLKRRRNVAETLAKRRQNARSVAAEALFC
jgi:hypothetical protein